MLAGYGATILLLATCLPLVWAEAPPGQAQSSPQERPAATAEPPAPEDSAPQETTLEKDPGWPRTYANDGNRLVLYQPQVDSWEKQLKLQLRAAFAFTPGNEKKQLLGALRAEADTRTDPVNRTVYVYNIKITDFVFSAKDVPSTASEVARSLIPRGPMTVSLDRVLAYAELESGKDREVKVSTEPGRIFVSKKPAIVLISDGEPIVVDVPNLPVKFVMNTNWNVLIDATHSQYYLLNGDYWLTAKKLEGPWEAVTRLPEAFANLPSEQAWADVKKQIPPQGKVPAVPPVVFYSDRPADLILLQGEPKLEAIAGTQLLYVENTDSDVFYHQGERCFYYLTAGRWFRTATPGETQWEAAVDKLPPDFARIPPDHPKGRVLASVPGTREAEDAVLMAGIPQTFTLNRSGPAVQVEYAGDPQFKKVPGTDVQYAANTAYDVFLVSGRYYLCYQGAWFVSNNPAGPWDAADQVPQDIYQIPPESQKYNVTYVTVQESSPTTVTYAYMPGYTGVFVAGGVVVYGTGYYYPPYVYWGPYRYPYYYPYPYYAYGHFSTYNPYTGMYGHGHAAYGPYYGYGNWCGYNPRTGTRAWGEAAYGPGGAARRGGFYNPYTGVRGWGYTETNYEEAWGERYVRKGSEWAHTGFYANENGVARVGRTSKGTGFVSANTEDGQGLVAKGQNNIYVGRDDSVYKRDENGNWYRNDGSGSWQSVPQEQVDSARQQARSRAQEKTGQLPAASTGAVQPGQTRRDAGSGLAPTNRTQPVAQPGAYGQREVLGSLERDAFARQQGAVRTKQYESMRGRGGRRGSTGGRRRR